MAREGSALIDSPLPVAGRAAADQEACAPARAIAVPGRVSIVLPAYNCEETIGAAVDSCLAQTHGDVEVIVVNDGSTDGTAQVLARFGGRIRVLHQENAGLAAARNAGTRAASGEFVAWMDGDDIASPQRLRIQVAVLAARPDIALVSSDFSAFVSGEPDFDASHIAVYYHCVRRLGGVAAIYPNRDVVGPADGPVGLRWADVHESLLSGNFVHPPTVMVRRTVFDEVGIFDESMRYSSDYDLILRIARTGPFAFVDTALLRYRISTKQMSHAAVGGGMPLETVRILEKLRSTDPALYARHQALLRRRCAEQLTIAAEMVGTADRAMALGLLIRALRSKVLFSWSLRAAAKILLPNAAISAIRRARQDVPPTA